MHTPIPSPPRTPPGTPPYSRRSSLTQPLLSINSAVRSRSPSPAKSHIQECTICYERLMPGTVKALPCGHVFHQSCVEKFIAEQCAICRTPFQREPVGPRQQIMAARRISLMEVIQQCRSDCESELRRLSPMARTCFESRLDRIVRETNPENFSPMEIGDWFYGALREAQLIDRKSNECCYTCYRCVCWDKYNARDYGCSCCYTYSVIARMEDREDNG